MKSSAIFRSTLGLALWCFCFAAGAPAQSSPESPVESQEEKPSTPVSRRRIVDKPVERSKALAPVDLLKWPFGQFGKGLDAGARKLERNRFLERAEDARQTAIQKGLEPLFGGLGTGSGFALGVNIARKNFLGSGLRLDVPLQYSTNQYAGLGAFLTVPLLSRDRLSLKTGFEYFDRPEEDFFGLGQQSARENRTNFRAEERSVSLSLEAKLGRKVRLGFPFRASNVHLSEGRDNRFPDLQQRFTPSQIPGFAGAELVSWGAFLDLDFRDSALLPTSGTRFYLSTAYFRDTGSEDFRFLRYKAEVSQYIPLGNDRVLFIRALGLFNDKKGRGEVPLTEKAVLGGRATMRGFREFRFYDDNALLVNAEYRWQAWNFADLVLFVDEGQVAPRLGDLSLGNFQHSHGIGVRFKSEKGQMFRIDVGHSREGWRFYLSFRPVLSVVGEGR